MWLMITNHAMNAVNWKSTSCIVTIRTDSTKKQGSTVTTTLTGKAKKPATLAHATTTNTSQGVREKMDNELSIDEAVEQYYNVLDGLKLMFDERDRLLAVIWSYMQHNNQELLKTSKFTAAIPTKRQYDPNKFLAAFGETHPELIAECVIPEHEETKVVKAKVDGRKALPLWKMGDDVREKLEKTLIPQKPEIKVTPIKKTEQPL